MDLRFPDTYKNAERSHVQHLELEERALELFGQPGLSSSEAQMQKRHLPVLRRDKVVSDCRGYPYWHSVFSGHIEGAYVVSYINRTLWGVKQQPEIWTVNLTFICLM